MLSVQTQTDFSGGSYQSVARELIPANGVASARNALLEEDGTIFKRGGSTYKTTVDFAAALTFIWDGYLAGGQRTVIASAAAFGVLDVDDITVISLGAGGTDGKRAASGNGLLFIPGASSAVITVYGGSRKTAGYTTGTLTTTAGSTTVAGAGTSWSANVDAGSILTVGGVYLGVVSSVQSTTALTLAQPAASVVSASAYASQAVFQFSPLGAVTVDAVATVSNPARLVVASGAKVAFSSAGAPFTFAATDYHTLSQGSATLGMESLQGTLFVFSTQGVFTISGMDYNLTDASGNVQQRLEQINRDLILWDQRGISSSHGALVVPCVDDVYLLSASAAPQSLATSIRTAYRANVKAGYKCGLATVSNSHYFLPVVNGTAFIDTYVLRLDRGGWTFWSGQGGTSSGFTVRTGSTPQLLSVSGRRVLNLTGALAPTASNPRDADGTVPVFTVVTRDYVTGGLRKNLVKKIRLRYDLNDAATDDPTLQASYSSGQVVVGNPLWGAVTWGAATWGPSTVEQFAPLTMPQTNAPEGNDVVTWQVITTESGVRPRFARFQFSSASPSAKLVIRSLEMFVRSGGRQ